MLLKAHIYLHWCGLVTRETPMLASSPQPCLSCLAQNIVLTEHNILLAVRRLHAVSGIFEVQHAVALLHLRRRWGGHGQISGAVSHQPPAHGSAAAETRCMPHCPSHSLRQEPHIPHSHRPALKLPNSLLPNPGLLPQCKHHHLGTLPPTALHPAPPAPLPACTHSNAPPQPHNPRCPPSSPCACPPPQHRTAPAPSGPPPRTAAAPWPSLAAAHPRSSRPQCPPPGGQSGEQNGGRGFCTHTHQAGMHAGFGIMEEEVRRGGAWGEGGGSKGALMGCGRGGGGGGELS